jgi:hypothetical protein
MIASGDLISYRLGQRMLRLDCSELDAALALVPSVGAAV